MDATLLPGWMYEKRWSLLAWTVATAVVVTGFLVNDALFATGFGTNIGWAIGFVGAPVLAFRLSMPSAWRAQLTSMIAGTVFAGVWPLCRWLVLRDADTTATFLAALALVWGIAGVVTFAAFAARRGWLIHTPLRRRLSFGLFLLSGLPKLIGHPPDGWSRGMGLLIAGAGLLTLVWPARKMRPATESPPA